MKQILIIILVLILSASTCNAQVFRKVVTSVTKCISANKAIIGVNVVRGYSIQEQRRHQIAQNAAHHAHQSTSSLNSVEVANAISVAAIKPSKLLAYPRLYDMIKLVGGKTSERFHSYSDSPNNVKGQYNKSYY